MKRTIAPAIALWLTPATVHASGHGPVFALATPTNPKGGFTFDTSFMGRYGGGSSVTMYRGALGYGVTENFKVSVSAPLLFQTESFPPSRTAAFTPMGGDSSCPSGVQYQLADRAQAAASSPALPLAATTSGREPHTNATPKPAASAGRTSCSTALPMPTARRAGGETTAGTGGCLRNARANGLD